MKIQIKMHSQLDAQLRPDMTLICQALSQMRKEPIKYNPEKVDLLEKKINDINELSQNESEMVKMIKQLTGDAKEALKIEKAELAKDIEARLDNVFMSICDLGGRELYNYTYDRHFNHIVAGLMGSTCYMKETFKELEDKRIRDIRVIANTVEQNGHHSTFGHSHLTLEITGIAKALAMVINNEKEYCASEKSARYTIMDNLDKAESDLFYKWKSGMETNDHSSMQMV